MRRIEHALVILALSAGFGLAAGCRPSGTSVEPEAPRTEAAPPKPDEPECCKTETPAAPTDVPPAPKLEDVTGGVTIPDLTLVNQDGQPVNVSRDLAQDKLLVINFIFTTCKGVCPPLGVHFGQLQERLGARLGREVSLVSISVDPATDTPERLKAWGKQFGAGPGWTLLTGPKRDVDRLLKALGVFTADKTAHSPFALVGRASEGRWRRVHGLTPVDTLAEIILGELDAPPASAPQKYFTDVPLVDQHGKTMRLYSDVLKGKVVVITPFFTSCRASCPRLIDTFAKLQVHYGDRVGKELFLISLTVDPETDTPDKIKTYAEQVHAQPGWSFLTGDKANVATALLKLGQQGRTREDHTNIFIIGNESTGLWKKAMGLAPPEEIIKIVDSVLGDRPS